MAEASAKRALIVGVTGQDGAYLARLLLEKGYEVVGTSRNARARCENLERLRIRERVKVETLNPADLRGVSDVLARVRPQEVYNLCGQSSVGLAFEQPLETFASIADTTATLLEGLRGHGEDLRFFNASSSECFGEVPSGLADEATPFAPRSPYAAAGAAAHWMTVVYREAYGLFACNGILFNHESPLRPERFVTMKIAAAAARIAKGSKEKLSLGNLDVRRDWGWAPEYVDTLWRMLQQERASDYVVATGRLSSLEEFVAAAFGALRLDWREHVVRDPALERPAEVRGFAGNAGKAAAELGWKPTVVMPALAAEMVRSNTGTHGG